MTTATSPIDMSQVGPLPKRAHGASTCSRKEQMLAFQAPYLVDKLVRSGVACDREQAEALFGELKKYLFVASESAQPVPMMSALVDAAWHQFILYTSAYAAFCAQHWGEYQHHWPRAPVIDSDAEGEPVEHVTTRAFVEAYRAHFGPLHDLWHNERCLRPDTRLVWSDATRALSVEITPARAQLLRNGDARELVCEASTRARDALAFVAAHRVFLLRELPGLRGPHEQLALVGPLVEVDVLNIAP